MKGTVCLIGASELADAAAEQLAAHAIVIRQTEQSAANMTAEVDLFIAVGVLVRPEAFEAAELAAAHHAKPWLRAHIHLGEGFIGPFMQPGMPGCWRCADLRQLVAAADRREQPSLRARMAKQPSRRDVWASQTTIRHMALLLAEHTRRLLLGQSSELACGMLLIHLKTLRSRLHRFLPDPYCPACGAVEDDSAERAEIVLQPNPKLAPHTYRVRSLEELKAGLSRDYFDHRCGLFNGKGQDFVSPFADVTVNLPYMGGNEGAAGRTHNYAESEMTAILEGLERYCGMEPRAKQPLIRGSYRELAQIALDPLSVGVYSAAQYELQDYPFQPFDVEQQMDWVWGYSLTREQPILVPLSLAYYSIGSRGKFVHETANGCALGSSLEEAIFHGMLEVIERDAFLMTWYARLPLPRLDLNSCGDEELLLMAERLEATAGYELHVWNATMEHGVPSVWVTAVKRRDPNSGIHLLCAAGAHPDPVRAVKSAVLENASMLLSLAGKFESGREHYRRMLEQPELVRHMEDHSMLYALPEAEERLHFLLDRNRPTITFEAAFQPNQQHSDLTEDLLDMVRRFRDLQLEVIVVNQTSPEIARNGLSCVKTLIPGMLPMTFGHQFVRLEKLSRPLTVPARIGFAKAPLTSDQLNPYPHPFP